MTGWPQQLQVNAWPGLESNRSETDPAFQDRLLAGLALRDPSLAPDPIDLKDWADPRVGWGLVLPDDDGLDEASRARGLDAPEALRELLRTRNGVVLRYRADLRQNLIRRYYDDGTGAQDILIASQSFGTGVAEIPRYLLIYATPAKIPWAFQFELQHTCFVGRIDIEADALERYVQAMLTDWQGSGARRTHSVFWAVDHDPDDITHLMRDALIAPLHKCFADDDEFKAGARFIDGSRGTATAADLAAALGEGRPAFVATSSHGMTGPLNDVAAMRADLGLLVDSERQMLRAPALLDSWEPDGAIWYAQACCSAGSCAQTAFEGLVPEGSSVERVLKGVAACGETMAPFPRALLSAPKPLRAFIGHVEPTFDWSVRYPRTGQYLTRPFLDVFYQGLFTGEPIGMALEACRKAASSALHGGYTAAEAGIALAKDVAGDLLALRLIANDWKAVVLIGDPAATVA